MGIYLASHPEIHFCEPKEPYFWSDDLSGIRDRFGVSSLDAYLKLFGNRKIHHQVSGEGSTVYLYSKNAVRSIVDFQPQAKFVSLLRSPVELSYALYMQEVLSGNEDVLSFEDAWKLQEERANGQSLPANCFEPQLLQYRRFASLGSQVERLLDEAPSQNILLLLFDDFRESPRHSYQQILEFLGVSDDGRDSFPKINAASKARMNWLRNLLRTRYARKATQFVKRNLGSKLTRNLVATKQKMTSRVEEREPLSESFRLHLISEFTDDRTVTFKTDRQRSRALAGVILRPQSLYASTIASNHYLNQSYQ